MLRALTSKYWGLVAVVLVVVGWGLEGMNKSTTRHSSRMSQVVALEERRGRSR